MTTSYIDNEDPRDNVKDSCGFSRIQNPQISPPVRQNVQTDSRNEPLQAQTLGALDSDVNTVGYEGFQFVNLDPMLGQEATWSRMLRNYLHLRQSQFYKMVHERAQKVSAAQQYQNLSDTQRAHVNQLIHEQRRNDPFNEWSCVYAKVCDRAPKVCNADRDDYETVSMNIVLMKRPSKIKLYQRTSMGGLVNLGMDFTRRHSSDPSATAMPTSNQTAPPFVPDQIISPGYVVQKPFGRPVSVTLPFTRVDSGRSATEDLYRGLHGHTVPEKENQNADSQSIWSSKNVTSDDEDESIMFDESQADVSSNTEHPSGMDCECQEPPPHQDHATPRQRSCSPALRKVPVASSGVRHRGKPVSRIMERKLDRYHPLYYHSLDIMRAQKNPPVKRARGSLGVRTYANKELENKYRIQRANNEKLRNRLLDYGARIGQWAKAFETQTRVLQKVIKDSRQFQRPKTLRESSSMQSFGCNCSNTDGIVNDQ